jgi:hypothetical protein
MCIIHIGGQEAEFLEVTVLHRVRPGSTDFWDGNWLDCWAEARVGAFRGQMYCYLRTVELEHFREQLALLYEHLSGEATLATMETWLDLKVIGDGRGQMEVRGQMCDNPGLGNVLDFRLALDQTYLSSVLRQLEEALERYPVVGR